MAVCNHNATAIEAHAPGTRAAGGALPTALRSYALTAFVLIGRVPGHSNRRNGVSFGVLRPPDKAHPALKRQGLFPRSYDMKTKCRDWTKNREIIGECIVCGAPIRYGCDPHHRSAWSGGGWDNAPERCVQDPTLKVWPVGKCEVHGIGSKACKSWYQHYVAEFAREVAREESSDSPGYTRLTVHDVKAIRQSIRQAAEAERGGSLA